MSTVKGLEYRSVFKALIRLVGLGLLGGRLEVIQGGACAHIVVYNINRALEL